jgi:hypothetical protein
MVTNECVVECTPPESHVCTSPSSVLEGHTHTLSTQTDALHTLLHCKASVYMYTLAQFALALGEKDTRARVRVAGCVIQIGPSLCQSLNVNDKDQSPQT